MINHEQTIFNASVYQGEPDYCDKRDENDDEEDEKTYYCEICDREFFNENLLNDHKNSHRTCGIDGCTFSAHPKLVEKHITMQHCTGLYERMRNLNTPEDIQKWIAERKRRYPTKTAVEQKEAEREEKIKRGEIIERTDVKKKPAGDKKKIREKKRKAKKRRKNELELVEVENEVEEVHPSGIPMFRGTNSLVDRNLETEEPNEPAQLPEPEEAEETEIALPIECSDDEDTQVLHNQSQVSNSQSKLCETGPAVAANSISAMASLVADYGSDSDDEPPEETPIKRIKLDEPEIPATPKVPEVSPAEESKPKKEELSRKHNKTKQKPKDEPTKPSTAKPIQRKRPPMLLEKLLSRSIQHERNYIAQCLKYIVENNFFDEDPGVRGEV